jgi:hypothetical protein
MNRKIRGKTVVDAEWKKRMEDMQLKYGDTGMSMPLVNELLEIDDDGEEDVDEEGPPRTKPGKRKAKLPIRKHRDSP